MQTLPSGWTSARTGLFRMETKVIIAGVEYGENRIASLRTSGALFSGATVSVGGCVAKEIDLVIKPQGTIPRMAEIRVFVRPLAEGIETAWLSKGVFYIDTRQEDVTSGTLTIHGYDAMLKTEQPYLASGISDEEWPKPMSTVVDIIADKIGVELDARTVIEPSYSVGYPSGYTMRDLLGHIAAAHGGNWTITDTGALRLVPLTENGSGADLGIKMSNLEISPAFQPLSRVTVLLDDENTYTAGDDTGRGITVYCPWGSQVIANDLSEKLGGYVYQPFYAQSARLDPVMELGDRVTVNGVTGPLAVFTTEFNAACLSDIEAPSDEEIDHEYPYSTLSNKEINRKIARTKSEIRQDIESITLSVEEQGQSISKLEQKVDTIKLSVYNSDDGTSSRFELTSNGVVVSSGNITFDGYVTFTGLADGTTTIDGGCIKTGEILADLIKAGVLQSADGQTFRLDLDNGTFTMNGSGRFQTADGRTYIEMVGDEMVMYSFDERTGTYLDKIHFGFISGNNPAGGSPLDYPYMLLGNSGGNVGMVKEFYNGMWVGNSVPRYASGNFEGMEGASGIFINTRTATTYVVNGTNMQNVYTGEAIAKFG